jgi:hypothetical protein
MTEAQRQLHARFILAHGRGLMRTLVMVTLIAVSLTGLSPASAYTCNDRHYLNSSGHVVHSPSCEQEQGSHHEAECRDGSTSFSEHRRGTCSHHGGVAHWD